MTARVHLGRGQGLVDDAEDELLLRVGGQGNQRRSAIPTDGPDISTDKTEPLTQGTTTVGSEVLNF